MRAPRAYQSIEEFGGGGHGTRGYMINSGTSASPRYFDLDPEYLVDLGRTDRTLAQDQRVGPGEVDDGRGDVLAAQPTVQVSGPVMRDWMLPGPLVFTASCICLRVGSSGSFGSISEIK